MDETVSNKYIQKLQKVGVSKEFYVRNPVAISKTLKQHTAQKIWRFPLRISSVNVTKFAGNCGFGHIYWRNS